MKKRLLSAWAVLCFFIFSNYSFALCVDVSDANLREGPGTTYEKTWEVFKYMPLSKVSAQGSWYKVKDVDGDAHWISAKLVTDRFQCAVVKVNNANVRIGPGSQYGKSPLSPALKYDSFKVLQIKSSWVKVIDEFGVTAWIFRNLLWIQ